MYNALGPVLDGSFAVFADFYFYFPGVLLIEDLYIFPLADRTFAPPV
jgi:hypothetical protein